MPAWVNTGFAEYSKRFPRSLTLKLTEIPPGHRPKRAQPAAAIQIEGTRLLAAVPKGARKVTLDEGGKAWSTEELARRLAIWMQSGSDVAFLIGGPDGLDPVLKTDVDETWSLSRLTFPHSLVRVVVAEQLYRAWSLINNHPYHRA